MTDPRGYVRRGEPLAIAATQVNWINDQMRQRDTTQPPAESIGSPYTWVYGKNTSGANASRWAVLAITGVEIAPTANDADAATRQFCTVPVLTLGASTYPGQRCVAIDPIAAGKIGRVAVAGAVQVKAADVDKLDGSTVLWEDANWALVRFGSDGGVRLGTISATWLKGTDATVTKLNGDGTPISPTVTFTATNHFVDISVDCGPKKVACASVGGTWILVAAEC